MFDLVILDYQLAEGDGLGCMRRIGQLDPKVPVLAISSVATADIAGELLDAGAAGYLEKVAVDALALGRYVREMVDRIRAERRGPPSGEAEDHASHGSEERRPNR